MTLRVTVQFSVVSAHIAQVKLTITQEMLQQIFAEKPYVHRAHTALVPTKLSEKDFWEKFFNHQVAKKVGGMLVQRATATYACLRTNISTAR